MKTALVQMDIVLGNVEANRNKALSMMEQGLRSGAELFVLPEMWTTGYKLDQIHKLGEPEDGPSVQMLKSFAKQHKVDVVGGSIAETRGGKVYNTAYAINQNGDVVAKYSKIHLIGLMAEDKYISPGTSKSMFDLCVGKVGMIICYDLRFTELPRALALGGAQALFVPAEWPTVVLVFIIPAKVFKNVYLTAHMMLFLSTFLNLTLPVVMGISGTPLLILSSVLCALYWTLTPAITRVVGRSFLGGDFTLGHHQQVGAFLASRVAPLFGKKEDDAEDLKLPKAIAIFRDNTISMTILMASVFLCIGIAAGHTAIIKVAGNDNWIIWLILRGFQFTAGIVVLLFGVRMFISSIVPAFKGISERVIPKAVPALDCPTVFPYSPVGAMLGFLSSVVAAIVVTLILLVVRSSIIVFPSPIIMFFDGCTMGVFGNKFGGWRGALAAGFVTSFLAHLGCLFIYPLMGPIYGSGLMFSNIDFTLVWLPILYLLKFIAALFGHV